MNVLKTALLLALAVFTALPARAQDASPAAEPEHLAKIRLVAEHTSVKPGEEIWVGIEQQIKPGWHTYWKNPGDSGTAPRVIWTLPNDFNIGPLEWPAPKKIPYGPLVNYGYEDNVVLLQKLKIPDTLSGNPVTLKARVEVLVCKQECIPEYGTYELTLNGESDEDNSAWMQAAISHLPQTTDWKAGFEERSGSLVIGIEGIDPALLNAIKPASVQFFPEDWGLVLNADKPDTVIEKNHLLFTQKREKRSLASITGINGLLHFTANGEDKTYAFIAAKNGMHAAEIPPQEKSSLIKALLFALLGGILLNLMPCVFPVLSIKALSLIQMSEKETNKARLHGIFYSVGVISSFLVIALLLITLKSGGNEIGWGFQLQNPMVVTLLAYLLFVIGLNLAGLFEIAGHFGNLGNKLTQGNDLRSSFFTGVLATLVATPCTAPFMGVAVGAALLLPTVPALCIFAALGFGLALPYLILSFVPATQKILPKPGAWMEIFRQLLAFPMFASCAWLVWVISQQAGPMGVFGALMGLVFIAFALWLLGHMPESKYWRYKIRILALLSFVFACFLLPAGQMGDKQTLTFGEPWGPEKLSKLLKEKDPVFVEMTAAWCITCKVNHAIAIDTNATRKLFEARHIRYMVGDWTSQDSTITEYLNSFGRDGVPLYIYYGPPDSTGQRPQPKILPQILTTGIISGAVQ